MKKLKRFFAYYRPHKRLFILDLICSFTISVANMFYPMIAREMMKAVEWKNLQLLITLGIVLGGIYIVLTNDLTLCKLGQTNILLFTHLIGGTGL